MRISGLILGFLGLVSAVGCYSVSREGEPPATGLVTFQGTVIETSESSFTVLWLSVRFEINQSCAGKDIVSLIGTPKVVRYPAIVANKFTSGQSQKVIKGDLAFLTLLVESTRGTETLALASDLFNDGNQDFLNNLLVNLDEAWMVYIRPPFFVSTVP